MKKVKLKKYLSEWMYLNKGNVLQIRITDGSKKVKVLTLNKPCAVDVTLITGTIYDANKAAKI